MEAIITSDIEDTSMCFTYINSFNPHSIILEDRYHY